ncbi:MAG: TonB-dependent receptor [Ignavibacteriae bacterium]|nr:TonB-dependent receptor [Ignavibacteriota bacterium]
MRTSITRLHCWLLVVSLCVLVPLTAFSQGITTAALNGKIVSKSGEALPGVNVLAVHGPSGTKYGTSTRVDGRYTIPNMRVGGPYTVTASIVGYQRQSREQVFLQLSQSVDLNFTLSEEAVQGEEVIVVGERSTILNASRTGAATAVAPEAIEKLPTINRTIGDFTRLTPQSSGASSYGGLDNRLNNVTVDGSYFNNSFGLAGQPGDRTNVAPISLDAIEQVQVNIAPYDVSQGNFVGAGVNTVTKSGTNEISGSAYYLFRHQGLVGTKAGDLIRGQGKFSFREFGVRIGGPIIPDRLFFFGSFEDESTTQPGTTYTARASSTVPVGGNTTRVLASDLDALSTYLKTNFGYETGPYQGYEFKVPARRFIGKLNFNLDENNKFSLRYNHLDSETDVLVSNSSSLGAGSRRSTTNGLNFANSNYGILENIRSIVGEWNSVIGDNMANNLIVGYSHHDESRSSRGTFFPLVDIRSGSDVYTTFGFEPFTPNNELRYSSWQLQDNFSYYLEEHSLTFGVSGERYESENIFFPGSQSVYVYNSLADFYTDANGYLANPSRDTTTVNLSIFQVRWSNIPGQTKPVQPLKVFYGGAYAQDEWQATNDLKLTLGLRVDVPIFSKTGYRNANADTLDFRDENGNTVRYQSDKLPDANLLFSPRFGFNWDLMGDRSVQIRGGSGIFTGRPAYVWISNQIGNTGVLTGFEDRRNTRIRPFNPNPDRYKPTNVTGAPASSYELALTDPDFRFPQQWRSNIAVDHRLPYDLVATAEFMYSKDVNGLYYINANLPAPQTAFVGADNRPRWTSNRLPRNTHVANNIVLKNENKGFAWNFAASVEKPFSDGFFGKAAYSYGVAKNTVDPGSIASGSWSANQHSTNPNNPGLGYSSAFGGGSPGHRVFLAASYRAEYFDVGATTVSLFWEGSRNTYLGYGNFSFTFSNDMNGDGGTNDLIYIPRDQSEMNFAPIQSGSTVLFTSQQQMDAFDKYINADPYLNKNRGKYAERGAAMLPMVYRADFSIAQEFFTNLLEKKNALEFRLDILNVGNLLNKNWGVGKRYKNTSNNSVRPLTSVAPATDGKARYQMVRIGTALLDTPLEPTTELADVWRIQFGFRYTFN